MKTITNRNLSILTTYKLIDTFYLSVEDGGGTCCQNCGRLITNIATVEDASGKRFSIGLDCAGTLTGIKGDFTFEYMHKSRFTEAKQARAIILKRLKEGYAELQFFEPTEKCSKGHWDMRKNGSGYWRYYEPETWTKYVKPMIKDLLPKSIAA